MSELATRDAIEIARANGEIGQLREAREQANAVLLWAQRTQRRGEADFAGEMKVRCEAALGGLDREANPNAGPTTTGVSSPLEETHPAARAAWRKLPEGAALDALVERAREDEDAGVTTAHLLHLLHGAHVSNNAGDNEWYTPAEYIDAAHRVMGGIDLDPASSASANEVIRAAMFFTADEDGLAVEKWQGRVWMNPPYARPLVDDFCAKLAESFVDGDVSQACVLVNNATETDWFHALAGVASAICFPRRRVRFWHPEKKSAPLQGQAAIYLGPEVKAFRQEFLRFGFTVAL